MHKNFKVLHITTSIDGGAGIAAARVHEGLLDLGIKSNMLVLSMNQRTCRQGHQYIPQKLRGFFNRLYNKLYKYLGFFKNIYTAKDIKGEFEIFTTPFTHFRPEWLKLVKEADIIHLHWVAMFINYPSFFKAIKGKKIVWTLHDMNPFLGGFHYKGDRDNNPHLIKQENEFVQIKKSSYENQNINMIFLNQWMKKESDKEGVFNKFPYHIIPNCIDFNTFKISEKTREKYNILSDERVLLFASQSLKNKRKGFDLLIQTLEQLKDEKLTLLTFGGGDFDFESETIRQIHLGSIYDPTVMSDVYNCADLFILPTREDNLPNVMLEAWACGIPVISFDNGGMQDYIQEGFNGELVSVGNTKKFAAAILKNLKLEFSREKIREFAVSHFSPEIICRKIIQDVYGKN